MTKPGTELLSEIQEAMGDAWLPQIYRERILKMRTRSYEFAVLPSNPVPQIQHTLLGIELKVGRRRMLCPDLATARYLSVFARAGCRSVAIPYDITKISQVADQLESSWYRMLLLADRLASNLASQTRIRRMLIAKVREEVTAAGAGPRNPEFEHNTKKRRQ
jgi:hypothetical protein